MTIFLIVFFLYLLLRYFFRERQKRAGNVFMVGSRFSLLPDHIRLISILGMVGIALVIVILTIMGYPLTAEQISHILTLGIVLMSVQYLPLLMIGENGVVSIDSQANWKDITTAHVQDRTGEGAVRVNLDFQTFDEKSSIGFYIHSAQIEDFEKVLNELTSIQLERSGG